jgi:hypothetical protein
MGLQLLNKMLTHTGRFHITDHKCCFYATNFSHKCILALVALLFLRYNIYLNGENMKKHCKGCVHHHNAGHPTNSPHAKANDWCKMFGVTAPKAVGQCKLKNAKKEAV